MTINNQEWMEWVQEDAIFKANNIADHSVIKLQICDMEKATEKIMINHLPHLQECATNNASNISKLQEVVLSIKKWLWVLVIIGIILIIESDQTDKVFGLMRGLLHF